MIEKICTVTTIGQKAARSGTRSVFTWNKCRNGYPLRNFALSDIRIALIGNGSDISIRISVNGEWLGVGFCSAENIVSAILGIRRLNRLLDEISYFLGKGGQFLRRLQAISQSGDLTSAVADGFQRRNNIVTGRRLPFQSRYVCLVLRGGTGRRL